jgi:hypothetical protein
MALVTRDQVEQTIKGTGAAAPPDS